MQWSELSQDVWNIILNYIGFDVKHRHVANGPKYIIDNELCKLTKHHNDIFDGFTQIIHSFWKSKRREIKSRPSYQMMKFINGHLDARIATCSHCDYEYIYDTQRYPQHDAYRCAKEHK